MGAGGVGDPRFVPGDLIIAVVGFYRAGAQAAKVGAGVRLGKDGGGQDFRAGQFRQPVVFLFIRAATQDQFGGDFGTGAKAANADVTARQLFGHNDHRCLAQAKAAEFLGDGQTEHAHFGQFLDDVHRDQFVFEVPFVGMGNHAFVGKAAELFADHLKLFVQTAGPDGRERVVLHQVNQTATGGLGVAACDQGVDLGRVQNGLIGRVQTDVGQAHDFVLAHHDAATDLGQIFAERDLQKQLFDLAELAFTGQVRGPFVHLAQRFNVGRQPCQTVCGVLVFLDLAARDAAIDGDDRAQAFDCGVQYGFGRRNSGSSQRNKIGQYSVFGHSAGHILSIVGHRWLLFCGSHGCSLFAGAAQQ